MNSEVVIRLEDLTFSYEAEPEKKALAGVTMEIRRGQCVVITGSSGCGKTTLTRSINGLIPAAYGGMGRGRAFVNGREVEQWGMDELACQVGSVFQNPRSQFFNLDTTSEIAFGCENIGIPQDEIHARVRKTAIDIGIQGLLDRDVRALSGGQKQLLALASVYAMGPDIFVLDEPTASLDTHAMRKLAEIVGCLKALGKTVVISEHRLWWLRDSADRIMYMHEGALEKDWTAEEFDALSACERARYGLRAWHHDEVEQAWKEADSAARQVPAAKALEISALSAGYKRNAPVLTDIALRADAGKVIALVGHNGAGKTTLARCITGLHRERSGAIVLHDVECVCKKRAGEAYLVMQEPGYQLFSDSVEGEIQAALACSHTEEGKGTQRVEAILAAFGMSELSARHPLSLSGGQQQRLVLAAGIAQGARVLVLDEPTSGLDRGNMLRVAHELRAISEAGTCVFVITHDFEFLCASCDEVIELSGGGIVDHYTLNQESMRKTRAFFGFDSES